MEEALKFVILAYLLAGSLGSHVFDTLGGAMVNSRSVRQASDRPGCPTGEAPPTRVDTTAQLRLLRQRLMQHGLSAYIVPMDDAHQSEYVADSDKRVQFLSGFSGSAGVIVVLLEKAALWSDGRYFLQMDAELDCNWISMKKGIRGTPSITSWLLENLHAGQQIGADPTQVSYDKWMQYEDDMGEAGLVMVGTENLVDEVWGVVGGRPPMPNNPLIPHLIQYAGKTWNDKLTEIRNSMPSDVDGLIVTALDETAWLFNLRGEDVPYNPVFFSYAIVERNKVTLYLLDPTSKLTAEVKTHLNMPVSGLCVPGAPCTNVEPYSQFFDDVESLSDRIGTGRVWVSPMSSYAIYTRLGANQSSREAKAYLKPSLVRLMKGRKNPVEVSSMRDCHKRDSATLVQFLAELESQVKSGEEWDEISASDRLEEMRRKDPLNRGLSFATISGVGSNGAIIHYKASNVTKKQLTTSEMYLLDSGGQYLDGTTDVTRTFHFGSPTDVQKEAYTRVLMGSINLALAIWPNGTYGRDVDVLAREPLWSVGWNYNHGTGHGLGMFLNVHEGPGRINIGYRPDRYESPMYGEMFFSDEPGYYEDGEFGVRLETIVMTKRVTTEHEFGDKDYLGFEEFTLVPFEPNLIKYELLTAAQRSWLNEYHARCLREVGEAILRDERQDMAAFNWLQARTHPLPDIPVYDNAATSVTARGLLLTVTLLQMTQAVLDYFSFIFIV